MNDTMKKFVIDQILFLLLGIAMLLYIPVFCGPVFTLILECLVVLSWGYLCRRILLLPLDLFCGKITQTAYFASQNRIEDLEFFKRTYYCEWKFHLKNNQTLGLFVPIAFSEKETSMIVPPPKNTALKITYYRFSKIMLQCTPIE